MQLNLKANHINVISIICASLVPLMVTGPFLPDLIISLLSVWFLYHSIKYKFLKRYFNNYFYFFISFCIICTISSLNSENLMSLKSSVFYFRIGIFALFISFIIDKNKKILDYFYFSFLITFFVLIVDGYFQHITGVNLFGSKMNGIRVSSLFGEELILGSYLSRLFPLFFAIFVIRKNKNTPEIFIVSVLFILIDVLIFISGERTAFFLLNLSTIFIVLFISKYKLLRATLFIISFLIIGFITSKNEDLYFRYIDYPIQAMGLNNSLKNSESLKDSDSRDSSNKFKFFTPGHDSTIRTAYNMFLDKPIFGHGPKIYRIKCDDPRYAEGISPCKNHPHNFYIQLLAETGIIGFLFLLGLLIYFIFLVTKHAMFGLFYNKKLLTDYQICLLAGLLITIWPFVPSGSIFNNQLMLFYGLQMGFFKKNI